MDTNPVGARLAREGVPSGSTPLNGTPLPATPHQAL
ncbi:hypothetical protein ACIPLA_23855 [Pseudomonas sp. NPDC086112]